MSKLSAFLHPVTVREEKEIVISRRFQDEKGNPVPFKIRALTQEENDALIKAATVTYRDRTGKEATKLNNVKYSRSLVVAATVEPDFRSKEMCDAYGTANPEEVPGKMLLSGEYQKLMDAILDTSNFGQDEEALKN